MKASKNRRVSVRRNESSATSKFCVSWGTGKTPTKLERASWDVQHPKASQEQQNRFRAGNWQRHRKFFPTLERAKSFALAKEVELANQDSEGIDLPLRDRLEAAEAIRRLAPYGRTLREAVDYFVDYLDATEKSLPLGALVDEYKQTKRRLKKSERTIKDIEHRLGLFERSFEVERDEAGSLLSPGRIVETITTTEIDDWLASLMLAPQSVNNYRGVVHAFFEYAVKRDYSSTNPVSKIDKVKVVDKPAEIFTPAELTALLNAATDDVLPALVIGAFAGLRMAEIYRLDWSEVHVDRGFIEVTANKSKTARRRLVRIEPNLAQWLQPFAAYTGKVWRFSEAMWRVRMEPVRKTSGITKWPQNGLRHSFGSYHLAKFGDAAKLALEMGHTTTREIFAHYRELVRSEEADQYWQISPNASRSEKS
jgi:integrase